MKHINGIDTDEDKSKTFDNTREAFIFIAQKHGSEVLLGKKLKTFFPDYTPQVSVNRKRLVFAVYENGAAAILQSYLHAKQADKEIAFKQAVAKLTEAFITQEAAENIIREFAEALGWQLSARNEARNMGMLELVSMPHKNFMIFLLVDTSDNMIGSRIGTINSIIEEFIPELKTLEDENQDVQVKVAVLKFSSGAQWLTPNEPIRAENFFWHYIEAGGASDFGDACSKLNEKLSVYKGFMKEIAGTFAPAIVLISGSKPTDDYKKGLNSLKQNRWFEIAIKVAIAVGEEVNESMLEEFAGSKEAVLRSDNPTRLIKMIKPRDISRYEE
ncbi:MAG: VWA domain-containing protein [Clostridiales Family XIII bacterium]|jgi:uncharacterized protein YegL|nr:VWA domain-containing protein [Clostridiales Family XIII bacterium]